MNSMFPELARKAQRGSKPRCHLLTTGTAVEVAARLMQLAEPFATVTPENRWMPMGFADTAEAELDKAVQLLDADRRRQLAAWWLRGGRSTGMTPNFDIASTCLVGGKSGLLLIEAKAHDQELTKEAAGRVLPPEASEDRKASHPGIGQAIEEARVGLEAATGMPWRISRDSHYQMSNRFAWSWKLTELGVPVVLVYLGFLSADEMADRGAPFTDDRMWADLVLAQSRGVVPEAVWGRNWAVNGVSFVPLIRSASQPLIRVAPEEDEV